MNNLEFSYFREVARTLNFNKAAERLYITQPALSRCIAKIEKEYGTELFIRDKHDVQLTAAGIALFNLYPKVEVAEKMVQDAVSDAAHGTHTRIKMGIQEGQIISGRLKKAIKDFELQNPNIRIDVVSYVYTELFDKLNNHELHMALSLDFPDNIYSDIEKKTVERKQSYALVSADHPAGKESDPEKARALLSGMDLMMVDWTIVPNVTSFIIKQCEDNGIHPLNVKYAPSYLTLLSWLVMGYGFVIMNQDGSILNNPDVSFIPLSEDTATHLNVYWNKEISSQAIPKFIDFITSENTK